MSSKFTIFFILFIPLVRCFHPNTRSRWTKPGSETEAVYSIGAPFSIRCNLWQSRAREVQSKSINLQFCTGCGVLLAVQNAFDSHGDSCYTCYHSCFLCLLHLGFKQTNITGLLPTSCQEQNEV